MIIDETDILLETVLEHKFALITPDKWHCSMLHAGLMPDLDRRHIVGMPKARDCMIALHTKPTPKSVCQFITRFSLDKGGDVYVSQAKWLAPRSVPPKHRDKYKRGHWQNVLMGCDMCVDVDELDISNYNRIMTFAPYLVVRTNRGFQAWFHMRSDMPENRQEREAYFQTLLDSHVSVMQKAGVDADWKCTTDLRHVFRFPGTLHRKGTLCAVLYSCKGAVFRMPSGILRDKRPVDGAIVSKQLQ